MIFRRKRDPKERHIFGTHPGDLAIVAVAALITVVFVFMLLSPKDFDAINRALAPATAPKPQAQPSQPGVTQMQLYDVKKK